jgi:hypothetical protein
MVGLAKVGLAAASKPPSGAAMLNDRRHMLDHHNMQGVREVCRVCRWLGGLGEAWTEEPKLIERVYRTVKNFEIIMPRFFFFLV